MLPVDTPPLDPSSGQGRRLLADELSKPEYSPQESLLRRAVDMVIEWFTGIFDGAAGGPLSYWWYAVVALALVLLAALVIWTLARLEPARRSRAAAANGVFEESGVSAADYRRRARAAYTERDYSTAVVDGYRAVASGAVERFLLEDRPGSTAREIALSLRTPFPAEAEALEEAAGVFGAVRYGGEQAGSADADAVLALEHRLHSARPMLEVPG